MSARLVRPSNAERGTNLSVIAMDEEWVVASVQDYAQDRLHGRDRDGLLLGALHVEDGVLDAVLVKEGIVSLRKVFLHQGAARRVSLPFDGPEDGQTYTMVLSLRRSM